MIKVVSTVTVQEVDGNSNFDKCKDHPDVHVKNHYTRRDLVVLHIGEDVFSVKADELMTAIHTAQSTTGTGWR